MLGAAGDIQRGGTLHARWARTRSMSARAAPRRRVALRSDAASSSSSSQLQLPLPPLLALPHDCQAVVLGALPPRALALICATCHSLRSAADDPGARTPIPAVVRVKPSARPSTAPSGRTHGKDSPRALKIHMPAAAALLPSDAPLN